jgi:hypothetical protein
MAHYLDAKNALIFYRIFGKHPHLCISLLNSMLPLDEAHRIVSLEYLPANYRRSYVPTEIYFLLNISCKDRAGRQFTVEIQMLWTTAFASWIVFNDSEIHIRQPNIKVDYNLQQPLYVLAFACEAFNSEKPDEYYHHYKRVSVGDKGKQVKGLEFVFIELPKFKPGNRVEKRLHELWLKFLNIEDSTREVSEELLEEADTREALGYLEEGMYSEAAMNAYDRYWDTVSTEKTLLSGRLAEGRAEGLAEGLAQGEDKRIALEKALEKERAERQALEATIAEYERLMSNKQE